MEKQERKTGEKSRMEEQEGDAGGRGSRKKHEREA